MNILVKLPAFLLAVYFMYWSLPLANLFLCIKAWKFIGNRSDVYQWYAKHPQSLQHPAMDCLLKLVRLMRQVPFSSHCFSAEVSQSGQKQRVQRRSLHVPGEPVQYL